jgi:hypothetical protein
MIDQSGTGLGSAVVLLALRTQIVRQACEADLVVASVQ